MTIPLTVPIAGVALLAINLTIYLKLRHGTTYIHRSAREFCIVSFVCFLAGSFALVDLMTVPWFVPNDSMTYLLLQCAGAVLALSTLIALTYAYKSRNPL